MRGAFNHLRKILFSVENDNTPHAGPWITLIRLAAVAVIVWLVVGNHYRISVNTPAGSLTAEPATVQAQSGGS